MNLYMSYQRETRVATLREYGVRYLAPSDAIATETISSEEDFIVALLEQRDPRLQLTLVPLFIRNPHLASAVADLVNQLPPAIALDLKTYYMAAVYLQHWVAADRNRS
jgi:hypothetical protein